MPSSRFVSPPVPLPYKGKIVLIHAHEDGLKQKSSLIGFLRGVARNENYDFWWDNQMDQPLFDEEIRRQLEEADLVVCVLSQGFFNSDYIAEVEAKVLQRRIREGLLVVPVKYRPFVAGPRCHWISQLHQVPTGVEFIYGSKRQLVLYKEVADYVKKSLLGRRTPYSVPEALYSLRQLPNETFTTAEQERLRADASKRAERSVPSADLRRRICEAARGLGASLELPLGKRDLARLDEQFLAKTERRNPDPKKIRWVLRACGMHPQGRAKRSPTAT